MSESFTPGPEQQPDRQWQAASEDKSIVWARDLNERLPDGTTVRDALNEKYGPEGEGWRFAVSEEDPADTEKIASDRAAASDTLMNRKIQGTYVDETANPIKQGSVIPPRGHIEIPKPPESDSDIE